MKFISLIIFFLCTLSKADTTIVGLPAISPASVGANDVLPMVNLSLNETAKLKLSDILSIPSLQNPTFTGTVTAPFFVGALTGNASTATTLTGILPVALGGTGQSIASSAFNALSPMTTLGDVIYGGALGVATRLSGNTTSTKKFLNQTGTGSVSAAPTWGTISGSDLPNPSASTLGGIESYNQVSHQWIKAISTSGVPSSSQPAFSDISGTIASTQVTAPTTQTFTSSSGTYTTPVGVLYLVVEMTGGGGAGGSTDTSAAASGAGAGGGAGAYCKKLITSPSATYSYAVGAGGTAGSAGNNPGNDGNDTTFGTLTAGKGFGGGGSGAAATFSFHGTNTGIGGTASNCDLNVTGGAGTAGIVGTATEVQAGFGGSNTLAGSAIGQNDISVSGTAGLGYGGGGSGGVQVNNGGAQVGGIGANGIIIVREFYQ